MNSYDPLSRLTKAEKYTYANQQTQTLGEYTYDSKDKRVTKKIGNNLSDHLWDGENLVYESNVNGNSYKYLRGLEMVLF